MKAKSGKKTTYGEVRECAGGNDTVLVSVWRGECTPSSEYFWSSWYLFVELF